MHKRILAGILHIGNIEIKGRSSGDSYLPDSDPALVKAMELLQVETGEFIKCVTKKKIQMRSETITTNLNLPSAIVRSLFLSMLSFNHINTP
jgi:myosin-5